MQMSLFVLGESKGENHDKRAKENRKIDRGALADSTSFHRLCLKSDEGDGKSRTGPEIPDRTELDGSCGVLYRGYRP